MLKHIPNILTISDKFTTNNSAGLDINIFISKLEKDKNNHATAIALNPKFDGKDKVFIEIEDSFWYYYADMSNYFE